MRQRIATLGAMSIMEIVSGYGELAISRDGHLQIPCNVDVHSLESFLSQYANSCLEINQSAKKLEVFGYSLLLENSLF